MISIQYLNIELDEERSSAHENSNTYLLTLWASFKQVYISTIDVSLYQWMYHLEFRLVLLGVLLPSIILSQYEALQTTQSTLEMQIRDISIGLFCKGYILVDPNNPLLSPVENSRCLYIQCRLLSDNTLCQVYVRHLLMMQNGAFRG